MRLRIAAVQLNPIIGQLEENFKRAIKLVDETFSKPSASTKGPDLIIFPELAITGYNFKSKSHIEPYLEIKGKGKTFELGKHLSLKYNCHTLLGYPEKLPIDDNLFKIYNSAMVISPAGSIIHNYRKSFLYETDETWGCEESPDGFQTFDLVINDKSFKSSVGICMDLNPYKFKAPFDKYEFSTYCVENDVQLVLVPTNWMNSSWKENFSSSELSKFKDIYQEAIPLQINDDNSTNYLSFEEDNEEEIPFDRDFPDKRTVVYWLMRFNPYFRNSRNYKTDKVIVICNRSGMEDNLIYGGSSSIYRINKGSLDARNNVRIDFNPFGSLGQGTEGVLLRDVDIE